MNNAVKNPNSFDFDMKNRYVIIMAGGVGSRFWPLSRSNKPKQFLDVVGTGETLLQQTFRRFKSVCPEENILVVTNSDHRILVMEQLGIKPDRILSEPFRKNTAPCIAYGTFIIRNENPDAVIAVTPADHIITNEDSFRQVINDGFKFAAGNDVLITLGIKPDKPETGYGYIHSDINDRVPGFNNLSRVKAFTEKPDLEKARSFLLSGDYYWNSGIFIWSSHSIIKALDAFLPDISNAFNEGGFISGAINDINFIKKVYSSIRSISIDYGVLEKAGNVFVLGADMGWSDLGTWSSLYEHSHSDLNSNAIVRGKAFTHECRGNLISITPGKVVLIEGLEDFIVVDTDDALLIIRKEEEQNIKQYLEEIKSEIGEI
jgi:mannose-1-phosphate guanylyltransferase